MINAPGYLKDDFINIHKQYGFTLWVYLSEGTAEIIKESVLMENNTQYKIVLLKHRDEFLVYILSFDGTKQEYTQASNPHHIPEISIHPNKKHANYISNWNRCFDTEERAMMYINTLLEQGITLIGTLGEDGTIYLIEQVQANFAKTITSV